MSVVCHIDFSIRQYRIDKYFLYSRQWCNGNCALHYHNVNEKEYLIFVFYFLEEYRITTTRKKT